MQVSRSQKITDWSLVVIINLMWATQVPVIRLIGNRLGPVAIAFIPLLLSTLLFLPVLWAENRKRKVSMRWRWSEIKDFVVPGLIGVFLMQYLYTVGSQMTLAANAGIITLTIPVIVAIFASIFLKEKLNIVRVLSFILAIAGVLLTSLSDITGADLGQPKYLAGNGVFFLACCCCGFYNAYCKKLVDKKYTETEILVYGSIIGSIASIPVMIWVEPFQYKTFLQSGTIALLGIQILAPESTPGGGWSSVNATQSLVDSYEMSNGKTIQDPTSGYDVDHPFANRDPRLLQTLIVPGAEYAGIIFNPMDPNSLDYWPAYNYTGYVGRKYIHYKSDFSDLYAAGLNIPLIRYAEVLLTYAEAKIESNEIDNTVYDAIDQVRIRAGLPAVDQAAYASQSQLRDLVRRERRVELALEGLRWYDVQRWKIGDEVMNGPVYGARLSSIDANGNVTYTSTEHLKVEDRVFSGAKNYVWPVPQTQLDLNKTLTQNPAY